MPAETVAARLPERIRAQVEFYFSLENLRRDTYLTGQMNERMMVPLRTVAGFKRMRALTEEFAAVEAALSGSARLHLEPDPFGIVLVGPAVQSSPRARCTIVLNGLAPETTREELQRVMPFPILHVFTTPERQTHVTFESELACKQTFFAIQGLVLRGVPVTARIRVDHGRQQHQHQQQQLRHRHHLPHHQGRGSCIGYLAHMPSCAAPSAACHPTAGHPLFIGGPSPPLAPPNLSPAAATAAFMAARGGGGPLLPFPLLFAPPAAPFLAPKPIHPHSSHPPAMHRGPRAAPPPPPPNGAEAVLTRDPRGAAGAPGIARGAPAAVMPMDFDTPQQLEWASVERAAAVQNSTPHAEVAYPAPPPHIGPATDGADTAGVTSTESSAAESPECRDVADLPTHTQLEVSVATGT